MSRILSCGVHQPSSIDFLEAHGVLPPNAPRSSYRWWMSPYLPNDELIITDTAVAWCQNGNILRWFSFERENEPVLAATVCWFPDDDNQNWDKEPETEEESEDATAVPKSDFSRRSNVNGMFTPPPKKEPFKGIRAFTEEDREKYLYEPQGMRKAIVVFLRTQAHVYFQNGGSFLVNLPFRTEAVMPTPKGLVIQARMALPSMLTGIAMGGDIKDYISVPTSAPPRLFSLTDPLADVGMAMDAETQQTFDPGEDLVYFSPISELTWASEQPTEKKGEKKPEVILAVTYNKSKESLTVWHVKYVESDFPILEKETPVPSGAVSRRRSSFGLGQVTGQSTPVAGGGGAIPLGGSFRAQSQSQREESSIAIEFDAPRASRRVSSIVSRADLGGSIDRIPKGDRDGSFLGSNLSFSQTPSQSFSQNSYNQGHSQDRMAVDNLLNELNAENLDFNMGDLGLKTEIVLSKLEGIPFKCPEDEKGQPVLPKVFTMLAPVTVSEALGIHTILLCVVDKAKKCLVEFIFNVQAHSISKPTTGITVRKRGARGKASKKEDKLFVPRLHNIFRVDNVMDADLATDRGISFALLLDKDGQFSLHSPWAPTVPLTIPKGFVETGTNEPSPIPKGAPESEDEELVEAKDDKPHVTTPGTPKKSPATPKKKPVNKKEAPEDKKGKKKSDDSPIEDLERVKVFEEDPTGFHRLEFPSEGARIDWIDSLDIPHRMALPLAPYELIVRACLETLRLVLGCAFGSRVGEGIITAYLEVARFLHARNDDDRADFQKADTFAISDWKIFVVTLFQMGVGVLPPPKPVKKKRNLRRSESYMMNLEWEEFLATEGQWGAQAEYLREPAWAWLVEEEQRMYAEQPKSPGQNHMEGPVKNIFIKRCIEDARAFAETEAGKRVASYMPHGCGEKNAREGGLATSLVALHLLREEQKLVNIQDPHVLRFTAPLCQLATWLGWSSWRDWYLNEDYEVEMWDFDESQISPSDCVPCPFPPPSIYDWIIDSLDSKNPQPFFCLEDIVRDNKDKLPPPFFGEGTPVATRITSPIFEKLTPRTKQICHIYANIVGPPGFTHVHTVEMMVKLNITEFILDTLPEGIQLPLREALLRCQESPPTTWGATELKLVGRDDLAMLTGEVVKRDFRWAPPPPKEPLKDVMTLAAEEAKERDAPRNTGAFDEKTEQDRQAVCRLIYKDDRRFFEAVKLLQTTKPPVIRVNVDPSATDKEAVEEENFKGMMTAVRTLATPIGRGLLYFSTRMPVITERYPINGFVLSAIIRPSGRRTEPDRARLSDEKIAWAFFHAGVAAALNIRRDATHIDSSWVVFNKPKQEGPSVRHAGFLLGLGLNGHLKTIAKWHAFKYLTPKHTMTSIGLLLGLAASFLGTMNTMVTKLLSVHVTRLLPPGSAELNLSALTQAAGVMGIGLLYCGTQHRRMSEVMLSEIEYIEPQDSCVPTDMLRNEGYRLAAGFSLGFICLGRGQDLKGLGDLHIVERLLALAVDSKEVALAHVLDKATAGATMALALMFLKTNDASLAKKIDIPDTQHLFDYIRPDILLLRTLAKHLIMWDEIEGTYEWIRWHLKEFMRKRFLLYEIEKLDSEDMPLFNIVSGLCFAIALKYAGSGNEEVRDVLLHYLDQFMRLCSLPALNYDEKLARNTVHHCQDLLSLCCATVVAGSGDLEVFRRLRVLHGKLDEELEAYGSHMAGHMAIGILFLSGGMCTFGTSPIAIAALVCAFYPLFPIQISDNRFHLQAFRHFWVLATEARCLVARDVNTNRPASIPVTISLRDGSQIKKTTPCLLPDLATITNVTTTSPQYWTVVLDFENNPKHLANFNKSQTIYVHRRAAVASTSSAFQATMQALDELQSSKEASADSINLDWLLKLPIFQSLDRSEKAMLLPTPDRYGCTSGSTGLTQLLNGNSSGLAALAALLPENGSGQPEIEVPRGSASVDLWLQLEDDLRGVNVGNADRLRNVRVVFSFVERMGQGECMAIGVEKVERLKCLVAELERGEEW
ncbi:hypothetical protein BJ508DRAFT_228770 [Ascobolus immersus RN42]|uniref:Uncharacterized protein n=1 Tax=Ascobolus immersus RN42 TaxID=1160509 RepID=A0A3N4HUV8_ASCIM|nr:hypothetical protein BJ508DRAFT_228770 [Ascobolus immersus RN42]